MDGKNDNSPKNDTCLKASHQTTPSFASRSFGNIFGRAVLGALQKYPLSEEWVCISYGWALDSENSAKPPLSIYYLH